MWNKSIKFTMPRGRVAADVWKSEWQSCKTCNGEWWVHLPSATEWAKKMPAETEIAAAARFFRSRWRWTVPVPLRDSNGRLLARHTQTNSSKIWRALACRVFAHRNQRLQLVQECPCLVTHLRMVQKNVRGFIQLRKCCAAELEEWKEQIIQNCYKNPKFGALLTTAQMVPILNTLPGLLRIHAIVDEMSWWRPTQGLRAAAALVARGKLNLIRQAPRGELLAGMGFAKRECVELEFKTALKEHIQDNRELWKSEYAVILQEKIALKRRQIELKRFVREVVDEVRGELDEPWDFNGNYCGEEKYRVAVEQEEMPRLFGRALNFCDLP